ncbi:hypothetical protein Agabi119p4_16 [Agaricus bisporus var. burnettii]|uniref:Uncharacterized protein n=1 Tax=Agaricus bisporus var. burnettii TaxID=192524 RepID=A0A8H7KKJ1_AGABI|nr:hypothetical protein Agabi119p4_16 [Agaricus bisporus var. burnettii]
MGKAAAATELVSVQTLTLLKCASSFVSVPGVGAAAEAALSILALAQTVKSNKADFQGLGEKACLIMATVIQKVNAAEQPNSQVNMTSLQKECNDMRHTMEDIKKTVKKHVEERKRFVLVQRVLYSQADRDVIKECKETLQTALDLFNVQSHIEVRQGVDDANKKLDHLVENGAGGGGGAGATTINQYTGGNAYSHTEDNSIRVTGAGNSVNISKGAPSPVYYQQGPYY